MVFENIKKTINKVALITDISEKEKELLLSHYKISHSILKVDGKEYPAWRIIHNNALGPGKGGIRFHPNVSEDEVKSLSFWMSIKNSLAGLSLGGAKGGVKINPKDHSVEEIEKVSREFVREMHENLGVDKDIPAPDVYTSPQIMAWMLDEFERIKGRHEPGMITGKPLALGGIPLRESSTSHGGYLMFQELFKNEINNKDIKIAIQGFGNAGWFMANYLHGDGYKVVAVSDSKGGVYDEKGLNIPNVKKTKNEKGTVQEYEGENITNNQLLELNCDILVLAALENQITTENANKINAKYIIELANGPVTSEADEILHNKGIMVVPDILANSGGVVGSYFEWVQNKTGNALTNEEIEKRFVNNMINNFNNVYIKYNEYKKKHTMRLICYKIAIERILDAMRLRGNR